MSKQPTIPDMDKIDKKEPLNLNDTEKAVMSLYDITTTSMSQVLTELNILKRSIDEIKELVEEHIEWGESRSKVLDDIESRVKFLEEKKKLEEDLDKLDHDNIAPPNLEESTSTDVYVQREYNKIVKACNDCIVTTNDAGVDTVDPCDEHSLEINLEETPTIDDHDSLDDILDDL